MPTKTDFFNTIFSAYYFLSYIYIIFQRSKVKKSHKIVGIKVFLTIFALGAVTFMADELDPGIGAAAKTSQWTGMKRKQIM
jgi:hypothetical protein